jgi:uncharacterized repeat protein (TIGR01451 family)
MICGAIGWMLFAQPHPGIAQEVVGSGSTGALERLSQGSETNLIVLFDDSEVELEVEAMRQRAGKIHDDDAVLAVRRDRYRTAKQSIMSAFPQTDAESLRDYDHLPLSLIRFKNRAGLEKLLADKRVTAIYEDAPIYPDMAYSLPFIGQPTVAGAGYNGSGQTVVVLDTGIDYTLPAFGSCSAPGLPASCRVLAAVDVNGLDNLITTANNHGTNVSGIVAGVATGTRIASFNALPGGSGSSSNVIAGINWAIANKSVYNITAINMSLGDSGKYTTLCSSTLTNPYKTPIANARAAGIIPVASSGNNAYTNGISNPACTPGVVSVGAVYDASWGGPYSWGGTPPTCTDSAASAADKIPCFSNSASFLTMLAPGAFITAAGIQMAGTSQAAPHVAGAIAVLRAGYPSETIDQIVTRLTSSGISITDTRNSIAKPRLNLLAAISAPVNDMFAARTIISGDAGQVTSHNLNATKEAGEPNHAATGGRSVWWSWSSPFSGMASFDTHGSSFNTVLAVYTGTTVSSLTLIAANDNDGSSGSTSGVSFTAEAGTEYLIAVDGYSAGLQGGLTLNWDLVQQADLAVDMSLSPAVPYEGDTLNYSISVTNFGPTTANGVMLTDTLPSGTSYSSASQGCIFSSGFITCDIGALAPNSSATFQISAVALMAQDLVNTAQVNSTTTDPNSANNRATVSVTINPPSPVPAIGVWGFLAMVTGLAGLLYAKGRIP